MIEFDFDCAIILDCTNTPLLREDLSVRQRMNIIRPLAPFALHEVCIKRSIPSTVINYTEFWNPRNLFESIKKWLAKKSLSKPLILASALFDGVFVTNETTVTETFFDKLKQHYPNTEIIIGGPLTQKKLKRKPYAVFQGRSLHLFEQWLDGKEIDTVHRHIVDGVPYFHNRSGAVVEEPIVSNLYDDYCLNNKDIVTFETRLGCKFNCSFCSFEFRNAKSVNDTTAERLHEFFLNAYNIYGITRFSAADDTYNEGDEKLFTLHAATSNLPFKPTIVGYNRFDIMMAKPWQAEVFDECGFHGHFFGIETLHYEASKLIRKGIRKEKAYEFLRYIRDTFPHWWTSSGYIVGLPYEPKQHIKNTFREIAEQNLLKALIPSALSLLKPDSYYDAQNSDFVRQPEKYGITVLGEQTQGLLAWTHKEMDHLEAKLFADRLAKTNKIKTFCGWEWTSKESVGYDLEAADRHISDYIERKIKFLEN
jgi:radical SAM superfamily enzyme YgiQ (UPF0313 family)